MDELQRAVGTWFCDVQPSAKGGYDHPMMPVFGDGIHAAVVETVGIMAVGSKVAHPVSPCLGCQAEQTAGLHPYPHLPLAVFKEAIGGISKAHPAALHTSIGGQPQGDTVAAGEVYVAVLVGHPQSFLPVGIECAYHLLGLLSVFSCTHGFGHGRHPFQTAVRIYPNALLAIYKQDGYFLVFKLFHAPYQPVHLCRGTVGFYFHLLSAVGFEALCLSVEQVEFLIRPANDVVIGIFFDEADAVGLQRTVVSGLRLEGAEAVTIVASQTIPRGQPYITQTVLYGMEGNGGGETVALSEVTHLHLPPVHAC